MTWSIANSKNNEARKIVWELIPYARGRLLDIGCGAYKVLPHAIGVDNGHHWGRQQESLHVETAADLGILASGMADTCFSSHLLEHFHYKDVPGVLREWFRVTKQGGHVILYLPDEDQYPKVGEPQANPDHKFDVSYDRIVEALEQVPCGWDMVDFQKRSEDDEYSLWFVVKKTAGKKHEFSWNNPKPEKTAAVVRFGAQGDQIQASSVLPWLKENGYHVTLYCQSGLGYEVIQHDPHIDRFIVCDKDMIPPQFLLEFFEYTKKRYTKWINLCESVEGTLLAAPGRANWDWPNEARAAQMDRNYLEWTHLLAGVPPPYRPKFYSTLEEKAWARKQANNFGKRNILWSLAGSSGHKVWPHIDDIILRILPSYPDVHVILVGDESCQILEAGWNKWDEARGEFSSVNPRVHLRSGKWTIRQSMAFTEVADLIIGTETGLLNAAGGCETPKIVCLSHSSREMLTKHWKNAIALQQPKGVGCQKSPCRQLHGVWNTDAWQDCPKHEETGSALCQFFINPSMMWDAVQRVLGAAPALIKRAA